MSRRTDLQVSFADLEFTKQGVFLQPVLRTISDFLDEQEMMIEKVRGDLERGLKNPATGRSGLTPAQVLRSLILMRAKNWTYRELRERIADRYTLRGFTDFLSQPVPKHHAFNRAFNRLTPETLQVGDALVRAANLPARFFQGAGATGAPASVVYTTPPIRAARRVLIAGTRRVVSRALYRAKFRGCSSCTFLQFSSGKCTGGSL